MPNALDYLKDYEQQLSNASDPQTQKLYQSLHELSSALEPFFEPNIWGNYPVPSREECDTFVRLYRTCIDQAMDIKHGPSYLPAFIQLLTNDMGSIHFDTILSATSLYQMLLEARTSVYELDSGQSLPDSGADSNRQILFQSKNGNHGYFTEKDIHNPKQDYKKMLNRFPKKLHPFLTRSTQDKNFADIINDEKQSLQYADRLCTENNLKELCASTGLTANKLNEYIKHFIMGCHKLACRTNMLTTSGITVGRRLDLRSCATSTMAALLGQPGLIATARPVVLTHNGEKHDGVFMKRAYGLNVFERKMEDDIANNLECDHFNYNHPNLLRSIANLQILDYICGNTNRHLGNMIYNIEDTAPGEITFTGFTGINNDTSFGTIQDARRFLTDPSDMFVVSQSMADNILSLTRDHLMTTLAPYELSREEINAAWERTKQIQTAITSGIRHFKNHKDSNPKKLDVKNSCIRVIPDDQWGNVNISDLSRNENLFEQIQHAGAIAQNTYLSDTKFYPSNDYSVIVTGLGSAMDFRLDTMNRQLENLLDQFRQTDPSNATTDTNNDPGSKEYVEMLTALQAVLQNQKPLLAAADVSPEIRQKQLLALETSIKEAGQKTGTYISRKNPYTSFGKKRLDLAQQLSALLAAQEAFIKENRETHSLKNSERAMDYQKKLKSYTQPFIDECKKYDPMDRSAWMQEAQTAQLALSEMGLRLPKGPLSKSWKDTAERAMASMILYDMTIVYRREHNNTPGPLEMSIFHTINKNAKHLIKSKENGERSARNFFLTSNYIDRTYLTDRCLKEMRDVGIFPKEITPDTLLDFVKNRGEKKLCKDFMAKARNIEDITAPENINTYERLQAFWASLERTPDKKTEHLKQAIQNLSTAIKPYFEKNDWDEYPVPSKEECTKILDLYRRCIDQALIIKDGPAGLSAFVSLLTSDMSGIHFREYPDTMSLRDMLTDARTSVLTISVKDLPNSGANMSTRIPLKFEESSSSPGFFTKQEIYRPEDAFKKMMKRYENEALYQKIIQTSVFKDHTKNYASAKAFFNTFTEDEHKKALKALLDKANITPEEKARWFPDISDTVSVQNNADENRRQEQKLEIAKMLFDDLKGFFSDYLHVLNQVDILETSGITANSRIDQRNCAMTTMAALLGQPDLIAKSRPVILNQNGQEQQGVFMEQVDGLDLNRIDPKGIDLNYDFFIYNHPDFLRSIADLQILDYICGNTDRHLGNMVYQTRPLDTRHLCFTGLTGIDNDTSFGTITEAKMNMTNPADMFVVSETVAKNVLALTKDHLVTALMPYQLSQKEIDAAWKRTKQIQKNITAGIRHFKNHKDSDSKKLDVKSGCIRVVADSQWSKVKISSLSDCNNLFHRIQEVGNKAKNKYLEAAKSPRPYPYVTAKDMGTNAEFDFEQIIQRTRKFLDDFQKTDTGKNGSDEYREMIAALKYIPEKLTIIKHAENRRDQYPQLQQAIRNAAEKTQAYIARKNPYTTLGKQRLALAQELCATLPAQETVIQRHRDTYERNLQKNTLINKRNEILRQMGSDAQIKDTSTWAKDARDAQLALLDMSLRLPSGRPLSTSLRKRAEHYMTTLVLYDVTLVSRQKNNGEPGMFERATYRNNVPNNLEGSKTDHMIQTDYYLPKLSEAKLFPDPEQMTPEYLRTFVTKHLERELRQQFLSETKILLPKPSLQMSKFLPTGKQAKRPLQHQ